jgi:hypothetical protein
MNDDNPVAGLEDKLTSVFRMIDVHPEQTKHATMVTLARSKYTLSDLRVVIASGDRDSAMQSMHEENRELRDELRRVRGAKGLTWDDFLAVCRQKVEVKGSKWRGIIARHLGLKTADLAAYERLNRVPLSVLKQLDAMEDLRGEPTRRSPNFHGILTQVVERLHAGGLGEKAINRLVTGLVTGYDGDAATLTMAIGGLLVGKAVRKRGRTDIGNVLSAIRAAGPAGITAEELERRRLIPAGTSLRKYDFVRDHLVLDSGRKGGKRGTAVIWVTSEFSASHAEAGAKATFSRDMLV